MYVTLLSKRLFTTHSQTHTHTLTRARWRARNVAAADCARSPTRLLIDILLSFLNPLRRESLVNFVNASRESTPRSNFPPKLAIPAVGVGRFPGAIQRRGSLSGTQTRPIESIRTRFQHVHHNVSVGRPSRKQGYEYRYERTTFAVGRCTRWQRRQPITDRTAALIGRVCLAIAASGSRFVRQGRTQEPSDAHPVEEG